MHPFRKAAAIVMFVLAHLRRGSNGHLLKTSSGHLAKSCASESFTCQECASTKYCFSDQSTVDVTWGSITLANCPGCSGVNGGSMTGLPYVGNVLPRFEKTVGSLTVVAQIDCANDAWRVEVTDSSTSCTYRTMTGADPYIVGGTICGGSASVDVQVFPDPLTCFDLGTATVTVAMNNNKCCKCDVSGSPTCIASTLDYCASESDYECDTFTGNEATCDDAP